MRTISTIILIALCLSLYAQETPSKVSTVQPKIMVIPYIKQGEDLRETLENDVNKRIVLTNIKEAFDGRGFTTIDPIAKLKAVSQNQVFMEDSQKDLKTLLIENSGADIYVEAEINLQLTSSGNSVDIILTGYEISTGNSLANKVGRSGKFYTEDIGRLGSKAVEQCAEDFLQTMQMKFTDIVENGRSIIINVSVDEGSTILLSSEVGNQGLALSDELELWMEEHAFLNNYHIQGTTDKIMIFDDVRIPLKDPNTGRNYNINRFALELFKFAKGLGINVQRSINGNTLYFTIK
ncbi:MAG: hypothetical protein IJY67_08015 [Paludibacteraceae bacterium]|nr:hypothetical protein [Bacteroidales bacterium]MBQ8240465.1 hypothetical protein [Bacteroides sp.]MBQ8722072.1 hypothetical protein [Paludibacteraceae bacterium]